MKRIFAAINLTEDARQVIRSYIVDLQSAFPDLPVRWEKPEKLHITVKFAGSLDENELAIFLSKAETAATKVQPFSIMINETGSFIRRRGGGVLWFGASVTDAARDPLQAIASVFDADPKRQFRPHITITRFKDPRRISDLIKEHLEKRFGPVEFPVSQLIVFESSLSPRGSIYTKVAEFTVGN